MEQKTKEQIAPSIGEPEIWMSVVGHEGYYEVSSFGNIASLPRIVVSGKGSTRKTKRTILKLGMDRKGYRIIGLRGKTYKVHRLVAAAFHPNPENKPHVNHKDLYKSNNYYKNLEWATPKEDSGHYQQNAIVNQPIGENHGSVKLDADKVLSIYNSNASEYKLARAYLVSRSCIHYIKSGRTWSHVTGKSFKAKSLLSNNIK